MTTDHKKLDLYFIYSNLQIIILLSTRKRGHHAVTGYKTTIRKSFVIICIFSNPLLPGTHKTFQQYTITILHSLATGAGSIE